MKIGLESLAKMAMGMAMVMAMVIAIRSSPLDRIEIVKIWKIHF